MSSRISKLAAERYVLRQFLHAVHTPGYEETDTHALACALLGLEPAGQRPILGYAAQGDQELRTAALAVALAEAETWVRNDYAQPPQDVVREHYGFLTAVTGYAPTEFERAAFLGPAEQAAGTQEAATAEPATAASKPPKRGGRKAARAPKR